MGVAPEMFLLIKCRKSVTWLFLFIYFFFLVIFFRCSLQLSNFCVPYGLGCYLSVVSPRVETCIAQDGILSFPIAPIFVEDINTEIIMNMLVLNFFLSSQALWGIFSQVF